MDSLRAISHYFPDRPMLSRWPISACHRIKIVATIFTIGHSTRALADFSRVIQAHEIRLLADIRAFPMSRRHPHFNWERLELWLPEIGSDYLWGKNLGGFRNYADYMLSDQFQVAVDQLLERAGKGNTTIMCAEQFYFHCHRMLVSDYLVSQGHIVLHILDEKPPTPHVLTKEARVMDGRLVYRGDYLL